MYNLRYHIATIAGIFLALALGLLLGASLAASETVRDTTDTLLKDIRSEIATVREERDELEAHLDASQTFMNDMVTSWIDGRLTDETIVILQDPNSVMTSTQVEETLTKAGAKTLVITLQEDSFDFLENDAVLKKKIAPLLAEEGASEPLGLTVSKQIVQEWKRGNIEQMPLTDLLLEENVLSIPGNKSALQNVDGCIDVAVGDENKPYESGIQIASAASSTGMKTVIAQSTSKDNVILVEAQTRGFSGVAKVETIIGQYTLVALLSGAEPGTYGLEGMSSYPKMPDDANRAPVQKDEDETILDVLPDEEELPIEESNKEADAQKTELEEKVINE